ncbi:SAC3 domain-containing protein 1 [Discoglossus pictus]
MNWRRTESEPRSGHSNSSTMHAGTRSNSEQSKVVQRDYDWKHTDMSLVRKYPGRSGCRNDGEKSMGCSTDQLPQAMNPSPPIGICMDMCPEKERREREQQGRLHQFETLNGFRAGRGGRARGLPMADPKRAVKEYSRPAAGKELSSPRDLRPPAVLEKTVRYLVTDVWDSAKDRGPIQLAEAYNFVFDRLRAVRQDLTVQRARDKAGALVLEGSLGFLLCAPYLVRELPVGSYNDVLHANQVRETFSELLECYREGGRHTREDEFQALLLLYDLGNLDAINRALTLPRGVGDSPHVRLALAINFAHLESNWVRLFRHLRQLNCLQACAFYRHISITRDRALRALTHAYNNRNCRFPLDLLTNLMVADSPGVIAEMCRRRGLALVPGGTHVVFLKATFKLTEHESPGRELLLVEEKRGEWTWAEVMLGEEEAG